MPRDILLAAVIGAVGLKGEVRAKLFTATPDALPRYKTLHTAGGRKLVITAFRPAKEGEAVIAFDGIRDRNAAEALQGAELYVERAMLPETDEDEFYHADLIGLEARDSEGRVLGKVAAIHNYGAGDVIEIARPDGTPSVPPRWRSHLTLTGADGGEDATATCDTSERPWWAGEGG